MIAIATPRKSSNVVPAATSTLGSGSPWNVGTAQKITPMTTNRIPTRAALRG